jgi:CheY-like chemotaxis protein
VLIVEDDEASRSKLGDILVRRGAEVFSAAGPGEAIYMLQSLEESDRPMLVLLDVLMPGLDGPLFVQYLRSDPRVAGAPVVLISALSAPALEQTMRDWRADGFILKSRGLLHIDQALESWLGRIANRVSGPPSVRRSGPPSSSTVG